MSRADFDPNAAARPDSGPYGLDHGPAEAAVHLIPVGFDATTSYRPGTAAGPEAILAASHQVDLYCRLFGRPYEQGIAWIEPPAAIAQLQNQAFAPARRIVAAGGRIAGDADLASDLAAVNRASAALNLEVERLVAASLEAGKLPVLIGGDHAVPFGAIRACARLHPGLGVLHFDAHADLRRAYEGFDWSHASILDNVTTRIPEVGRVVQVGIRDLCDEERERIEGSAGRIHTLYDDQWARARAEGSSLVGLIRKTLDRLPEKVYVTFDVDGLEPALCPGTGTPVPGGLSWGETGLWLEELARSGRRIVGLDLVEVAPGAADPAGLDSWDAIVGARLLYRLIGCALASRG
jgi:agmatinase